MRTWRLLGLLTILLPVAGEEAATRVDWVGVWSDAFRLAREAERPVMVCINSKDGETANDTTAKEIYHDPEFVALSRKFVMVVISTITHWPKGECPRFKKVTCQQHLDCWKELRSAYGEQLATAFAPGGEMITPQHVWFAPDGTLLRRKEYFLDQAALLERMRRVLDEVAGKKAKEEEGVAEVAKEPKDAPLSDQDRAELQRIEKGDREARRAALANLLATEKIAAHGALVALLQSAKSTDVRCDVCRALGLALVRDARFYLEECLQDKSELVRSFAAVALEHLAQPESIAPLAKRARRERDSQARKNMYRALGACGGPSADKAAAKALFKALHGDKQNWVRKHAALSLRHYKGEAAKLVLKQLEQTALRVKDRTVRGGIIYTLAFIGNEKTTVPVLRKILDKLHEDYSKSFVRTAIRLVRGQGGDFGRAGWWIFAEDRDDPARQE
ncbi:MAG: HEAT repeat domain-containing protein [Planctomycetota bacterium]|jgi:HEAT repeat protein